MTGSVSIDAVLVGKAVPFRGAEKSAIQKTALLGQVQVGPLGLFGDEQADPRFHGGPDKAIQHFAFEHYALWRQSAPDHPKLNVPGAFGENISTLGLTETNVCIGDRYQLGTAIVEVSQPRQPCWKQGHIMNWPTLPKLMVREAKSGWYYRVIEPGSVAAGDRCTLRERPHPEWTVARVFSLVMHRKGTADLAALSALVAFDVLFSDWREMAAERMRA